MTRNKAIVLVLSVFAAVAAWAQSAPITVEQNGIKLTLVAKADTLEATVTAKATGWVSVGFNPTTKMKDADFLIGYVKDGKTFVRDDFGTGAISHKADEEIGGKNTIVSFSGSEENGVTSVTFVVPRDSGDSKDAKLVPGKHTIILGFSNSDNFTGMHKGIAKATVELP